jgi:hypothetical protein
MARLFTTPREIDYFSHLNKELTKDINGQKIFYYSISRVKTMVHDVYEESTDKIFNDPIEIECWVKWGEPEVYTGKFGIEYRSKVECYVQNRDLIDKEIVLKDGDFFTFGPQIFEVTYANNESIIHGQVEYVNGFTLKGTQSRKSQFKTKIFGPTYEGHSDEDAVQDTFVQQRGFVENRLGPTNDKRAIVDQGVITEPIDGPAEVSIKAKAVTNANSDRSSFYGDDDS